VKNKLLTLAIVLILASVFLVVIPITPTSASPGVMYVPGTHSTIQYAVNNASSGDIIIVAAGTYAGAVVDKNVTILGASGGASIITSGVPYKANNPLKTAFRLDETADGAEIMNFKINCNSSENFYFAIFSRNADNVTVDSLIVNDAVQGISNWGGSNWEITNNILNNTEAAGGGGIAIWLGVFPPGYTVCSGNLIQNNTITATATAPDYTCPGIGVGLDLRWGAYDGLTGSEDISRNQIINNNITAPGALNGVGIEIGVLGLEGNATKIAAMLGTIHDNTIRGNTLEGADFGVYFYTVANLEILENEIMNCNEGVHIKDGSSGNTINHNNIFGNAIGLNNTAEELVDAILNYWGDSSGPSGVGPGTGDAISENVTYSPWLGYTFGTTPMTYNVDPTGKIQDAIADANSGDTILVYNGTYRETLVINKSITLKAASNPVIEAPDVRNTYTFPESTDTWDPIIFAYGGTESGGVVSGSGTINVTIVGFEIDGRNNATASPTRFVGILYRNVNPGVIANNSIHHMYDADEKGDGPQTFGIMVYGDSNVTIEYNEVRDFSRGGIGVQGDAGAQPDPVATVERNTVVGNGLEAGSGWWAENGIQTAWGAGGSIIENNVSNCKVNNPYWVATGIMVYDAADAVNILDNSVADCDTGIAVISPSFDLVDGNVVTGCTWDGIRLGWPVDNCTVSNNIISNNWAGIGVWDASDNTIENNIVKSNEYGIIVDGDSHNNVITRNDILNNMIDGILVEPYGGFDPSGTEIHCNNIVDNANYGVNKIGLETVNARCNWWGAASGPYHNVTNTSGLGDRVSDNVDYYPWSDVQYPILGDINNDCIVNIFDILIAATAFGSMPGDPNWNPEVDLDNNGIINILDLVRIAVNFGKGCA